MSAISPKADIAERDWNVNQALDLGTKYGSNALQRVASEAEHRPLITVAVALGIGILIGAAILGSASSRR